jgi:hypothetical protein
MPIEYKLEGTISSDGKILKGTGFSVTHISPGVYVVDFDHPFFYQPPEITLDVSGLTQGAIAKVIDKDLNAFKYFTIQVEPNTMYLKDFKVNFSVFGLKD